MAKKSTTKGRAKRRKHSDKTVIEAIKGTGRWLGDEGEPASSGGIVTTICARLNIGRTTFYEYLKIRPAVSQALEDERESMLDLAEDSLMNLVAGGELGAICFYLKCKGKQRGYVEKQEVDANVHSRSTVVVTPEKFVSVEEWEAFIASQQK